MTDEALKFNESNKDKPYCQGQTYIGCGRGGSHWEHCESKERCPKYADWKKDGKPITNSDEHVGVHYCPVKIFRLCFLCDI